MQAPLAPLPAVTELVDRSVRATLARAASSLSPASGLLAATDWAVHLAASPGKQAALAALAVSQAGQLARYAGECLLAGSPDARRCVEPPARDRRFAAEAWQAWPFNVLHQSFLLGEQWWAEATHGIVGVERHHEDVVAFVARQLLDVLSPGNGLLTNPVVLQRTLDEGGANLARGARKALEDFARQATPSPPPAAAAFQVGRDVACTLGKVVLKNRLVELIQYAPTTAQVHPEPILIVPAWIMKYYILDLAPQDSLVKFLVDQGHTVFCISWKNPGADDRDLGMDDYLELGFHAALDAVNAIVPGRRVHAAGYCLGGTLLAVAAAAMARDADDRLASMTLFAAQTDFSEPGELALFIDESQVSLLEAQMAESGYLTAAQMAGAFQMLRSYDLLWSRMVNQYLLGEPERMNDLMAWNADPTRMPARMHSQYLRRLFLRNDLAEGRYPARGKPVVLGDIALPVFMVGTQTDHVAPWRSVYKLHHLSAAEITFVLTSGGHNAGIVSPPGHPGRHFQQRVRAAGAVHVDADDWLATTPDQAGSWWPAWQDWLARHSGPVARPPRLGARGLPPLADAPGSYVLER